MSNWTLSARAALGYPVVWHDYPEFPLDEDPVLMLAMCWLESDRHSSSNSANLLRTGLWVVGNNGSTILERRPWPKCGHATCEEELGRPLRRLGPNLTPRREGAVNMVRNRSCLLRRSVSASLMGVATFDAFLFSGGAKLCRSVCCKTVRTEIVPILTQCLQRRLATDLRPQPERRRYGWWV